MNKQHYIENGRKGGEAKAKKYWGKIRHVITLFVKMPQLTQTDIAKQVNVSQAFVSKHTSYKELKIARLSNEQENIDGEYFENMLLKIKLDIELKDDIQKRNKIKI